MITVWVPPATSGVIGGTQPGDGHTLAPQPGQFPFEIVDDKGEDDPTGVIVWLVGGQSRQAPPQKHHVHASVVPVQRGEPVGCQLLAEAGLLYTVASPAAAFGYLAAWVVIALAVLGWAVRPADDPAPAV